jgi:hypothetical protein
MALLEDPTIQRILNEVNKAASGGALGIAGKYISEPATTMTQFESQLSSSDNNFYNQDQAPLFYPTPEMFGIGGVTNFDNNMNFNSIPSMLPMPPASNFDLYTSGLYNTTSQNYLSPYENYNGMTKLNSKHQVLNNNSIRNASNVSSPNDDLLLEHHRHQEYPTIPPTITSAVPNLGLNVRTTPQLDQVPIDIADSNEVHLTTEQISNETNATNLPADKANISSSSPISTDDIGQQHSSKIFKYFFL